MTYTPDPDFSGTDHFDYRARDASENSERATVTVTVTPNAAPIARIKDGNRTIPDSDGEAGENVHLDGSTSEDQDGTIASYKWFNQQQVIGSGKTIDVRLPDGDTVIRLEVTDNDGATDSSTATISVEKPNVAPTARIKGGNRTIPDSDSVAGENVHPRWFHLIGSRRHHRIVQVVQPATAHWLGSDDRCPFTRRKHRDQAGSD